MRPPSTWRAAIAGVNTSSAEVSIPRRRSFATSVRNGLRVVLVRNRTATPRSFSVATASTAPAIGRSPTKTTPPRSRSTPRTRAIVRRSCSIEEPGRGHYARAAAARITGVESAPSEALRHHKEDFLGAAPTRNIVAAHDALALAGRRSREAGLHHTFDAIVIGAGQAGTPLAVRLAQAGHKTLLVEREHVGGTCVNDGCTPTKAMVASARAAHVARHAAAYGVETGVVSVDLAAVKARKDKIVQASVTSLGTWIDGTDGLTYRRGHARFTGPRTLAIGDDLFEAQRVFLNVGARTFVPAIPGLEATPYLTNTTIMNLDEMPDHLVVVGGSYIGLEFAQIFRRFGAAVTILEQGERLIGREDPDVSDAILAILKDEGITIHLGIADLAVARAGAGTRVSFKSGGVQTTLEGSHLLMAVGRRPNTDDLGLAAAGLATNDKGFIEVDDELRTSVEGIWALGDVNGRGAFTHTSYNDYEIVAANLLDGDKRRVSDRIPVYGLFIDPPLGRVGMTEAQARSTGRPVLRGVMPMARVGRARERGRNDGIHEGPGRRGQQAVPGCCVPRDRGRRSRARHP